MMKMDDFENLEECSKQMKKLEDSFKALSVYGMPFNLCVAEEQVNIIFQHLKKHNYESTFRLLFLRKVDITIFRLVLDYGNKMNLQLLQQCIFLVSASFEGRFISKQAQ